MLSARGSSHSLVRVVFWGSSVRSERRAVTARVGGSSPSPRAKGRGCANETGMHHISSVNVFLASEYRRRLKARCVVYKGGRCERVGCGYSRSVAALDFHHRDKSKKDFSISSGTYRKWAYVVKELDKCIMLCSNCHREEHERLHEARIAKQRAAARLVAPERQYAVERPCGHCCEPVLAVPSRIERCGDVFCNSECRSAGREKAKWPDRKTLKLLVWAAPVTRLAWQLGVSSVAVKKRCRRLGIATPSRGYWSRKSALSRAG